MTATTSGNGLEVEQLRGDIRALLADRADLSLQDLGRLTTLSTAAVRNFLSGANSCGRLVVGELRAAVDMVRAGEALPARWEQSRRELVVDAAKRRVKRVMKKRNFYQTTVAAQVARTLGYCTEHAAIGVVTGEFGCGKTEAVNAWRRGEGKSVDVLLYEFNAITSGNTKEFLREIAELLGVDAPSEAAGFRAIVAALKKAPALIVLDQCETCCNRVLQVVRQIWDGTHEDGVGVVLLAAPVLVARLMGSRMADLGALSSRVGVWVQMQGVTREEMAAIVRQEGIEQVQEGAFDVWFRACGGSMRRVMKSVDLLRDSHAGKVINERTIAGVAAHLWGMALRVE